MYLYMNFFFCLFRSVYSLINETVDKVKASPHQDNYAFMRYLYNQKNLNHKDLSVIAFSLFTDGLSTVISLLSFSFFLRMISI